MTTVIALGSKVILRRDKLVNASLSRIVLKLSTFTECVRIARRMIIPLTRKSEFSKK